jgi:hypothetical protein
VIFARASNVKKLDRASQARIERGLSRFVGTATRRLLGRRCACAPSEASTVPSLGPQAELRARQRCAAQQSQGTNRRGVRAR